LIEYATLCMAGSDGDSMRCPRCNFVGEPLHGGCAHCGYQFTEVYSISVADRNPYAPAPLTRSSGPLVAERLNRGDVLRRGRYRLIEQLVLPENQQDQGTTWLVSDVQAPAGQLIMRQVASLDGSSEYKMQVVRSIALRFSELSQHPGFPKVLDVFSERDDFFIVLQHADGEPLAKILNRQGGALPERVVAEYGRQLCEMLTVLARHQPPLVHGAISPDTILVSPDKNRVSLMHMPLFSPHEPPHSKILSGYRAPEQVRGNVEPSSDLYSLAATLHHAVTGYDPSERMAFFHPPARRLNPTVSPRMETILTQELRLSPQQRYARPFDMQKDLAALLSSYGPDSDSLPAVTPQVLRLESLRLRQRSKNRSLMEMGIFAGVVLLVLLGFLLIYLRPFAAYYAAEGAPERNATATALAQQKSLQAELALEQNLFQQKHIGISDGRFIFDTFHGRSDVGDKEQAASDILQGNWSAAVNAFTRATTEDPVDGEALIYNEDLHILLKNAPYVTIVLGLPIDNSDADINIGRSDMQSAYLAQHRINVGNLLPGGLKLRILIDNSGSNDSDVGTVAQFVANRVSNLGNQDHIIAVIGWPYSSQTINAESIIASARIPLISQTASSVKLSGSSPYFFRVNPPDDQQGKALGAYAVNQLGAKTILVMQDQSDPYSVSLANAFTSSVQSLHATAVNNPNDFFTETTTTVRQYQQIVFDAARQRANLIFIAGLDVDAIRLAHALGNASRLNPGSTYLANLKILGGDAVDTGLLLGQGNGPDAMLAREFPQDMQRLIFTAFGHAAEWDFLKVPESQQPTFFTGWSTTYQSSGVEKVNAPVPGKDAILTYDAIGVTLDAASLVKAALTGQAIRDALASLGQGTIPAYQGISGRILFDNQGNPIDKAIVILQVKGGSKGNQIVLLKIAGTFFAK
jgi:ABC-type branched-subunit amino acid transport system substrate-binding protein/serine/threonine protein kinase